MELGDVHRVRFVRFLERGGLAIDWGLRGFRFPRFDEPTLSHANTTAWTSHAGPDFERSARASLETSDCPPMATPHPAQAALPASPKIDRVFSPEVQSPARFPRLDPAEHFLCVAIGREHRIEDLLHEAVSHDQGETLQEDMSADFERGKPQRVG